MVSDTQFVNGAQRLGRRIASIRRILNVPALTEEIGDLLLRRTKARFLAEVSPDDVPWVPLAESTLRRKQSLGYGGEQKLVRTGKMRDAIQKIRGGIAGATFTNTGAGVRIGITDPEVATYARVQNKGSKRIPRRRFLGIGRLDVKAVDSLLRRKARQAENT